MLLPGVDENRSALSNVRRRARNLQVSLEAGADRSLHSWADIDLPEIVTPHLHIIRPMSAAQRTGCELGGYVSLH